MTLLGIQDSSNVAPLLWVLPIQGVLHLHNAEKEVATQISMPCFKYSLVFLVLEEWLLYPSYSWGSYAYVTATPTPPRYIFEVIIYFCYFCFSGLISFKQHLYCLGERSLTAPDGSPSRLNMLLESSYFMVMSLVGQMRPTTTSLQLSQRRKVALATAHTPTLWTSMGRAKIFLKISSSSIVHRHINGLSLAWRNVLFTMWLLIVMLSMSPDGLGKWKISPHLIILQIFMRTLIT